MTNQKHTCAPSVNSAYTVCVTHGLYVCVLQCIYEICDYSNPPSFVFVTALLIITSLTPSLPHTLFLSLSLSIPACTVGALEMLATVHLSLVSAGS